MIRVASATGYVIPVHYVNDEGLKIATADLSLQEAFQLRQHLQVEIDKHVKLKRERLEKEVQHLQLEIAGLKRVGRERTRR